MHAVESHAILASIPEQISKYEAEGENQQGLAAVLEQGPRRPETRKDTL
jgi:hypothetical protein